MLNLGLLRTRFGQYGAAWLGSFMLVLLGDLGAALIRAPIVAAANVLLLIALIGLAVVFALFVARTAASGESGVTRTVLLALGFALLLPLLWAPVLGAVLSAYIGGVSIEYSSVYAGFRVIVGNVIFGVMSLFTHNPYVDAGIAWFQNIAILLGFFASLVQLWQAFIAPKRRSADG
jgi:hypothetical protein